MNSIVIPVYNGETSIGELVERLVGVFKDRGDLQIVLINDCSPDNSHAVCLELVKQFTEVTYVRLAKNVGEHNAVMAGLHQSRGDYIVIMDDDFQNPPEEVIRLFEKAKAGDHDVVYSYYEKKKHSLFRNLGSALHNRMATYLLRKPADLYLSSFKCINRWLASEITKYHGPHPYIDGLILRCTQNIGKVQVQHDDRQGGRSGYTLRKLVRLWLNMFLNFSVAPLRLSSILGITSSALGFFATIYVIVEKVLRPETPLGWPSLVAFITTFSGIQLIILGLLGEYLGAMFLSSNQTPQFSVREIHSPKTET